MGQVGTLTRISQETLRHIKDTKSFDWKKAKETVEVDRFWEPVMFIFGNGTLGGKLFINLFMAENCIYARPDDNEWDPAFRYHAISDLDQYIEEFDSLTEMKIRDRIDIEKINQVCMYPLEDSENSKNLLVQYCQETMDIFRKAKTHKGRKVLDAFRGTLKEAARNRLFLNRKSSSKLTQVTQFLHAIKNL